MPKSNTITNILQVFLHKQPSMIGFVDSGIGGASILNACKEVLAGQQVFYLCDNNNAPYGSKSKQQIEEILLANAKVLAELGCKVVVVACNTATAAAIKHAREKMPEIIFIGTEPNIKAPIALGLKNIAVLCTPATAKHSETLKKFEGRCDLICIPELATMVENEQQDIAPLFDGVDCAKYDAVVIGCTHYTFIEDKLRWVLFKNAQFFDSREGVAKRLKQVLLTKQTVLCTLQDKEKQERIIKLLQF